MIPVTKPFVPPLEQYMKYLEGIWDRKWLTNNGPLLKELEIRLCKYLKTKHTVVTNNGTIAIQLSLKALGITKEVITTPYSYVATTSSLVWEGCTPVFVDIDKDTLNINPKLIESSITPNTEAILATHVFGNPCQIDEIELIAAKHGLKVIYDASHCFGVKYKGESIFNFGNTATCSFHATKLFHTIEGGAVFTQNDIIKDKLHYMRNFGHDGYGVFAGLGINGKNSELHAAMGLSLLDYIDHLIEERKTISEIYDRGLQRFDARKQILSQETTYNYAYYPLIFESVKVLKKTIEILERNNVSPRRYFYPSLDELPYIKSNSNVPVSRDIASKSLCLPLYSGLKEKEIDFIINLILASH